jgi:hypothetical protein
MKDYILFTKRTNYPKLGYLLKKCKEAGLRVKKSGKSFHAPCSWVHKDDEDAAWAILSPIDNIPDDDGRFA